MNASLIKKASGHNQPKPKIYSIAAMNRQQTGIYLVYMWILAVFSGLQ
jgi:hypothetical protein